MEASDRTQPVPDGGVQPDAEPTPEPAPQIDGDAPWAKDLQERFSDENIRSQVDQYVRDTVQPYVTQLEQGSAEDRYARKLWNDFTENPADTYIAVTREMFGDDTAEQVQQYLDGMDEEDVEDIEFSPEFDESELPPRVQQAVEAWEAQQQEDHYYDEIERVAAENPDLGITENEELFHPFVAAAQGDFDEAVQGFANFMENIGARAATEGEGEGEAAPPVMGSDNVGGTPPPVEEHYDSLDDAIDAFVDEQQGGPPPVL